MKKKILFAGLAVIGTAAAAVPASAWFFGKQVERTYARSYAMIEDYPDIRVVDRSYERDLFSARETVTFELFGDSMRAMLAARKNNPSVGDKMAVPRPVQFSMRSIIQHGPYLGSDGFGAAAIDSELIVEGEALQRVSAMMGGQSPFQSHTVVSLAGTGRSTVNSPAFQAELPGKVPAEPMTLTWGGLNLNIDFDRDLSHYTMQGGMPHLELADAKGGYVSVKDLQIEGDQTRLFADEPMLFGGSMKFSLASMKAQGSEPSAPLFEMGKLSYQVDAPVKGDFIDLTAKMGAEIVRFGDRSFGPAHYDFSLNHLHSRSFARLFKAWLSVAKNPAAFAAAPGQPASMAAFAPLAEPAKELMAHDPEFRLDRLSFNSAAGEAKLSARAAVKGAKEDDFANPMMLLGKLDAGAELTLPESLVGDFFAGQASPDADAEAVAQRTAFLQQRIDALETQGVLVREGGVIKSRVAYSKGQLTVNGQPFNPFAMGG